MTNREAIKEFKERITLIEQYGYANLAPEFTEAMKMAISALEKQIEKPPVQVEDEDELCVRYECPACGLFLVQRRKNEKLRFMHWPRFCNCGQRLDWSAER